MQHPMGQRFGKQRSPPIAGCPQPRPTSARGQRGQVMNEPRTDNTAADGRPSPLGDQENYRKYPTSPFYAKVNTRFLKRLRLPR